MWGSDAHILTGGYRAHHEQEKKEPDSKCRWGRGGQAFPPVFEDGERLFYAAEKAKNRQKRTIEWHRENLHAFKKAKKEQRIELDLQKITHRTIRNNLVLYSIEKWGNLPQTINMRLRTLRQFFCFLVD
jgi:site-specific recombinase XerC